MPRPRAAPSAPTRVLWILFAVLAVPIPGCRDGASVDEGAAAEGVFAMPSRLDPDSRFSRVVLVTIDTLRADHLRNCGYPRDTAPILNELASRGVRFARAMAPIPHMAPSHASMFTGQVPSLHGLLSNGQSLPRGTPTLADLFRNAGF